MKISDTSADFIKKSLLQEKNILCQCYKRNAFQKRRWILIEIHVSK